MSFKIIFMGTPKFALPILKAIYESEHKILEVYTQPATKSGRGQKLNHSDIFNYAEKLNLKELTASLGNGVSFMSSIYLTHPQYHDAGVYGGDSGGSGGN